MKPLFKLGSTAPSLLRRSKTMMMTASLATMLRSMALSKLLQFVELISEMPDSQVVDQARQVYNMHVLQ